MYTELSGKKMLIFMFSGQESTEQRFFLTAQTGRKPDSIFMRTPKVC